MSVGKDSNHSNATSNNVMCVVSVKFTLHAMILGKSEDVQKDWLLVFAGFEKNFFHFI